MALAGATQMTQHQPTQRKKGRATQAAADDEPVGGEAGDPGIEWRWGARAEAEIGEKGVARFVEKIYQSGSGSGAGGEGARSGRGATGEKLMTEIARASGSKELADVTVVKKKGKDKDKDNDRD